MQDAVKLISPDSNVAVVVVVGERETKSAVRAMTKGEIMHPRTV
jgi:hypothetical protein